MSRFKCPAPNCDGFFVDDRYQQHHSDTLCAADCAHRADRCGQVETTRKAHERAAGMALSDAFFVKNGVEADRLWVCNERNPCGVHK